MRFLRRLFILIFAALAGCFYYYKFQAVSTIAKNVNSESSYGSSLGGITNGSGIGRVGGTGQVGTPSTLKQRSLSD